MKFSFFAAALLVGALIRAAALPLPGTRDTIPWRVWSYVASQEGVSRLYGVGGSPPEWRILNYQGTEAQATYPPLALHELGLAGRVYRFLMHGQFPNTTALMVTVKTPAAIADALFAVLLYFALRKMADEGTARWATVVYWLNPAVILDGVALGYLDPQFVLPIGASLVAAAFGRPALAGALGAAAILTKPQAAIIAPAVAVLLWNRIPSANRTTIPNKAVAVAAGAAGGIIVTAILVGPIVAAGGGPNMLQALGRLNAHDMLSGNACNLWWIVGYLVRAFYTIEDFGRIGAFVHETKILQISRFMEVGFPNPRPIGVMLVLAAAAWALWTARRSNDLWTASALGAFLVHAYATLAVQVHENHLFAAVPLLVMAAAVRRPFVPVLVAVTAILFLNLNLFYGISEDVGYAIPRSVTLIDFTVVLAAINCAALVWHGMVFRRECARITEPAGEAILRSC